MSSTNGHSSGFHAYGAARPFENGVYCPLTTPFTDAGEVNVEALKKQVLRLAKAKMGLVLLGTNGEASHLSDEERALVISSARSALDEAGLNAIPLLVGTGGGSARHTIKLAHDAKKAGADYSIVICPGYFAFAMGKDKAAIKEFFNEVMDNSPLPVMIYNFPGAASGIDLDSDTLIELSEHPNCFGAKVLPGFSDYLLPAMVSRHTGCITGSGNVFPKLIVKLYETALEAIKTGNPETMQKALVLQDQVSAADWAIVKSGIAGTKYCLDAFVEKGMGGRPRAPLPAISKSTIEMCEKELRPYWEIEQSLQ